jgi:hypothetical protein
MISLAEGVFLMFCVFEAKTIKCKEIKIPLDATKNSASLSNKKTLLNYN